MSKSPSFRSLFFPAKSLLALSLLASFTHAQAQVTIASGSVLELNCGSNSTDYSGLGGTSKNVNCVTSLYGQNTYTGNTTINAGTLEVNYIYGGLSTAGLGVNASNTGNMLIGTSNGASGALYLGYSPVTNRVARIGDATGGTGLVTVTARSVWTNTVNTIVGFSGTGTLNINYGVVNSADGELGANAGGKGTVNVSDRGSQWNSSGNLFIGNNGTGILNIVSGGVVNSAGGTLGYVGSGTGTVKVSDQGSQWNSSTNLSIGDKGTGILNIVSGGVVNSAGGAIASSVRPGSNSRSNGTVSVTGPGSQWSNSADLTVGLGGPGVLNIENGGVVSNVSGYIDGQYGRAGTVTVTGQGSQWNNSANLLVGTSGINSTLNIENGGVVSSANGYVGGRYTYSKGSATVTGSGSQWNVSKLLNVGVGGDGYLHITNGGVVNSATSEISSIPGGVVRVTGAGSQWNTAASLSIATYTGETGSLSIEDSGKVTAQTLAIGAKGAVYLGQGSQLSTGNGTTNNGSVNFEGDNSIQGNFINNGSVAGSAGTLSFMDNVNGAGSYAGNVAFKAAFNPGNSPAAVNFNGGNVSFASGSVLNMELFGGAPGAEYDQLVNMGTLDFDGTLNLVFGNDFIPLAGSDFALFDFNSFFGSFGTAADGYSRITVTGYDRNLLDFSHLAADGRLGLISVMAVPEPETYTMVLAGLALMGTVARRRRNASKKAATETV